MKECSKCHQSYPLDEFYKSSQHADGLYPWCRQCKRDNYKLKHSETNKAYARRTKYGITDEHFQFLRKAQDYRCAICKLHESKNLGGLALHVDHCHDTGQIRGLLCRECNLAVGYFKDDPGRITEALNYLTYYRNNKEVEKGYPVYPETSF